MSSERAGSIVAFGGSSDLAFEIVVVVMVTVGKPESYGKRTRGKSSHATAYQGEFSAASQAWEGSQFGAREDNCTLNNISNHLSEYYRFRKPNVHPLLTKSREKQMLVP